MKTSKFKMTEIGEIPTEWDVKKLGECCINFNYGVGAEAIPYVSGRKYIRITDIDERSRKYKPDVVMASAFETDNSIVNDGDILVARTGASVGKSYCYDSKDKELVFAGFLMRFHPENINSKYVFLTTLIGRYAQWVASESARSGQPGINIQQLRSYQIPIPPLAEQKAIAEALSDVDALIAAQEELIEKKRTIKQGAMQELLTGKKRLPGFGGKSSRSLRPLRDKKSPSENTEIAEFKQTELGEIPVDWEVKRLGDCGVLCNGYAFKSSSYKENGKYKVITIANVQDGSFFADTASAISDLPRDLQCHQILNKGDILVSMTGNVGRTCCVSEKDCLLNQRVGKFNSIKIDKSFFYAVVQDKKFIAAMVDKGQGGAQANISKFDIEEYLFPLPSLAEQKAIAEVLSDMDAEISEIETQKAKFESIKQGMMQELLTGKTRLV